MRNLLTTIKTNLLKYLNVVCKVEKTTFNNSSIFERVIQPSNKFNWFMSLLSSKNGFRGEYLARYIVSRFAFISESSVGEDFGIDFYCGLSKEVKNPDNIDLVQYDKPFILQIKTDTKGKGFKNIILENDKIETLFNMEVPFFIGILNLKTKELNIHTTSSMWYSKVLCCDKKISKITFKHRKTNDVSNTIDLIKPSIKKGDFSHSVDLGLPIITLKHDDLENNINSIRKILSLLIDMEFENISNKRLGLSYFRWLYEYQTGDISSFKLGYKFVNSADDSSFNKTVDDMINTLHPFLISLALSAKNDSEKELYENIISITRYIKSENRFNDIHKDFKEIYEVHNYDTSDNKDLSDYEPIKTSGYTYTKK